MVLLPSVIPIRFLALSCAIYNQAGPTLPVPISLLKPFWVQAASFGSASLLDRFQRNPPTQVP